jgi:hypothetical protein
MNEYKGYTNRFFRTTCAWFDAYVEVLERKVGALEPRVDALESQAQR